MDLPDYFIIDLPSEATLTPTLIQEAAQTLKHNRERYLLPRSTARLIDFLVELGREWLRPDYPFRKLALELPPERAGFSREVLEAGLDRFFARFEPGALARWIEQELGHESRLDELSSGPGERDGNRAAMVFGPELQAHFAAGNLPCPTFLSMVAGLLVRSAQFVKCATGATDLPRLFAHSIYELDPKLGACLELAAWKGGDEALEAPLLEEADCVTATGSDAAIASVRKRVPASTRFLGYGQRLSFGYLTRRALAGPSGARWIAEAAQDVVAWDQLGCLSPHVLYVEQDGSSAERFAEKLAEELARQEARLPRAKLPTPVAASIANRRAFYEIRAAHSPETLLWKSAESTAWTVVYEADPRFQMSCLHRFVYVKGVKDLEELLYGVGAVRELVSTVGLAATEDQFKPLANTFARWGAPRICPLGRMQQPPLAWRHDGRPVLADLVAWADWEF